MSIDPRSFTVGYFEQLYSQQSDPWNFATSEYEQRKYAATLEVLNRRTFRSAFEVGCSIGIFTRQLSVFCEALFAADVAEAALVKARINCKDLGHVTVQRMQVPAEWPSGTFDLILFSEMLYFLGPDDIAHTALHSIESITPDGLILLVNWTGETDYPCGGDEAAERYLAACGNRLTQLQHRREPFYRLDLLMSR